MIWASAVVCLWAPLAVAQSTSTNYKVDEVFFGNGGELNACSATYCAKQAIGETAVGNSRGTVYQSWAGFDTDRAPYLAFSVSGGADLGVLSTGSAATTTATFKVKTYLAGGYVVQSKSAPPTSTGTGGHVFAALASHAMISL